MNYEYYRKLQRKEWTKNILFITLILVFATISTYFIYENVKDERDKILKTKYLEVTYHEKTVNKVMLDKVKPMSDYVGLTQNPYTFTIKNDTAGWVKYKVELIDDIDEFINDDCEAIPHNALKVGIHAKGEVSKIYNLDDLENGLILVDKLAPRQKKHYTLRIWVADNILETDLDLHYHGLIKIEEE